MHTEFKVWSGVINNSVKTTRMTIKVGTLCFIIENGKVLLIHRNKKENDPHEGKYVGVGGKLEEKESPYDCCVREVKEETGLDVKPVLRGVASWPTDVTGHNWTAFIYLAKEYSGELISNCKEGTLEWVEIGKVKEKSLWGGDFELITYALDESKKFFYLEQHHKNGIVKEEHAAFF